MAKQKYSWMSPEQKDLYDALCEEFDFKNLISIGRFLNLKHPYHGSKLIFEAKKKNKYLSKILEEKIKDRKLIADMEEQLRAMQAFNQDISCAEDNLQKSLGIITDLKDSLSSKAS